MLAIVDRARPTLVATSSWLKPNSSIELSVGVRGLQRIEIFALQVLDQGELELVSVRELTHDCRDAFEARPPAQP